ncbi:hypothetical protein L1887_04616 [Cichorium endivia]|nr:hypothetical protein L1887_04616 [Cichorium endivia]
MGVMPQGNLLPGCRFPPSDFSNFSGYAFTCGGTSYRYEGLILSIRGHGRPYVVILDSGKRSSSKSQILGFI